MSITSGSSAPARSSRISRASASPFTPGMHMSRTATSKAASRSRSSIASAADPASDGTIPHPRTCLERISRFVALSSTTSTRNPRSSPSSVGRRRLCSGPTSARIVTWKVEPAPTVLSAHIPPPIRSASRLLMARPSPVPPYFRVIEASTCVNESNSTSIASGPIPIPVSTTAMWTSWRRSSRGRLDTVTTTSPASVNFTAFDSRLVRIWRTRDASPNRVAGTYWSTR